MQSSTYQVTAHLESTVPWLAPGALIRFQTRPTTPRFSARVIANHRGGYLILEQTRLSADPAQPFWAWDGKQRLRLLTGTEAQVARALAAGEHAAAEQAAGQLWHEEIQQQVQQHAAADGTPPLTFIRPVTDTLVGLVQRFWQEQRTGLAPHPYSQVQHFPVPLPVAARFVLRAVQYDRLYDTIRTQAELGRDGQAASCQGSPVPTPAPTTFYHDAQADRSDPTNWTEAHPLVWCLSLAFDDLYLERDEDLVAGGWQIDALEPLSEQERHDPATDLHWLPLFISLLASDERDELDAHALKELLDALQSADGVLAVLAQRFGATTPIDPLLN